MNNENSAPENCAERNQTGCGGRREFLVKASTIAGGVVLSLSGLGAVSAQKDKDKDKKKENDTPPEELVFKLDAASPLGKVGGTELVETKTAGKVLIVRTGELGFAAFRAKCPHKGGPVRYDEKTGQLGCSWHGSQFDKSTGAVLKGPAKDALTSYPTGAAVTVSVKAPSKD
ncbi:MAG: Rieske 2Fe-2S domain-containing protein [Acidobacteria bacterium]|nr:Rieske 2Fe-2S domain-containing protein [Acidobacteriota bacterium]